jgi:hypothetical protein
MKKKLVIFIFIIIIMLMVIVHFGVGIFADETETKYTEEEAVRLDELSRTLSTPNPYIRNPDVDTDFEFNKLELSSFLLPVVEWQVDEESMKYELCLDCEFKEDNPEYCEDQKCSPFGKETNELNFFFCDNPYVNSWDTSTMTINNAPDNAPSSIGQSNQNYYRIWHCLDKYKKDLVRNSNNCDELLDKTRPLNQTVFNNFKLQLPDTERTQLETAINNPTDSSNGIPTTDNTIEDYVLHNKYIQHINSGFNGFRDTYKDELKELEEQYSNPEVDKIFATCFGIYNAPSPSDVVCPIDGMENQSIGNPTMPPPPPTPSVHYGNLDSLCSSDKLNNTIQECTDAYEELSGEIITPINRSEPRFPQGCGLLNSDLLIFNSEQGNPSPSIAPLCKR